MLSLYLCQLSSKGIQVNLIGYSECPIGGNVILCICWSLCQPRDELVTCLECTVPLHNDMTIFPRRPGRGHGVMDK